MSFTQMTITEYSHTSGNKENTDVTVFSKLCLRQGRHLINYYYER